MQSNFLFPVTQRFPKLEEDARADIVIVGAGMVGICSAYFLQQKGYRVIVLEEDEVGTAATGASSGILYYGSGTGYLDAIELFGKMGAELLWKESKESIELLEDLIQKNDINSDYRKIGAVMVATDDEQTKALEAEHNELSKIGIDSQVVSGDDIKKFYTGRNFLSGLHFPDIYQIHPAIFCAALAKEFDIKVFEQTPYTSYKKEGNEIIVKTPKSHIACNKLIIATNLAPLLDLNKNFEMESSIVFSSKTTTPEEIKKVWPQQKIIWTMEEEYDIIYQYNNCLILELFKMGKEKEKLAQYYPSGFEIDKQWGDSWAKAKDWLPIIGKLTDDVYAAVAMGDQGITMSFTAARKIVDMIEEKEDDFLNMCSIDRFK